MCSVFKISNVNYGSPSTSWKAYHRYSGNNDTIIFNHQYRGERGVLNFEFELRNFEFELRVRLRVGLRVRLRVGLRVRDFRVRLRVGLRVGLRVRLRVGLRVSVTRSLTRNSNSKFRTPHWDSSTVRVRVWSYCFHRL